MAPPLMGQASPTSAIGDALSGAPGAAAGGDPSAMGGGVPDFAPFIGDLRMLTQKADELASTLPAIAPFMQQVKQAVRQAVVQLATVAPAQPPGTEQVPLGPQG